MLRPASTALALSFVGLTALTLHCGSDGDGSAFDDGNGNRDGGADGSNGDFGPGFGGGDGNGNGNGGGKGDGGAEVCDGIDNDGDGRIDNIDRGNDGICDCLLIATLGVKGTVGDSDVFKTWLNGKSDVGAADLGNAILTPELLAKYQVIVAQNVKGNHAYSDDEVKALKAWVDKGGGFLTLIGYSDAGEADNVNRLLAPLGTRYNNVQILGKGSGSTVPVTLWKPSPVTEGVSIVGIDNGYEVQGNGSTPAPELASAKEKDGSKQYVVLRGQPVGSGHVLTWGDEWITFNGEWKDHADYQVERFWLNMIKWLTPATQCQVPIPAGIK